MDLTIEKAILASEGNAEKLMNSWNAVHGATDPMTDDMAQGLSKLFPGLKKATSPSRITGGRGGRGSSGTFVGDSPLMTGNFLQDLLNTQLREKSGERGEFGSLKEGLGLLFDEGGKLRGPMGILKQIGGILENEILVYLDQQSKLLTKINEQTGMTGKLSEAFREEIMKASPEAIRLGITFEELSETITNVVAQSGQFKLLSSDTIEEMALASKFTDDMVKYGEMVQNFTRAGVGAKDMAMMVERMGLKSMTLGLNARETTKIINENLKNLNLYGFREGVDGLNRMAQKSIEFRMNMESVFNIAKQVWEPDKALELVANLQVIGGAFGDLNDPIKLMYMATNNVEGLQDALIGAAKSLVTYNEEQGRFAITGANLRRAKAMADELGMSMEELTQGAVAAMERTSAASALMASGLDMKDEDKEFLTNLAQMKGGRMVIEVPESLQAQLGEQTEIAMDSMTKEQAALLLEQKQAFEKMSMEDVARQQVTAMENIERDVSFLRAVARVNVGREVGDAIEKMLGVNQRVIADESKNLTDKAAKSIGRGTEALHSLIVEGEKRIGDKLQIGKLEMGAKPANVSNEAVTNTTASTTAKAAETTTKTVFEHRFVSDSANVDELYRLMWRDPKWQENVKKSYHNPHSN